MLTTSLNDWHRDAGAKLVDFAGWEMPIQYLTIVSEHETVRNHVGLFDISHMGRLHISGEDACSFLDYVTTIDVPKLAENRIRYALATNTSGGILDDILVYRRTDHYLVVVNASNREKIVASWTEHSKRFTDAKLVDQTLETSMLALQGPQAAALMKNYFAETDSLKYYRCLPAKYAGEDVLVSRTGYTGEDGFEVIGSHAEIMELWKTLYEAGQGSGLQACGLGCRDTLRLEAGMPLYGHELSEEIDPLTADLSFAVSLESGDFVGRDALQKIAAEKAEQIRIGLVLEGRRIAREGAKVLSEAGDVIGEVTSGTFSPTLQQSIAMAYAPVASSAIDTMVKIDIRGKVCSARVTSLPFYQRKKDS